MRASETTRYYLVCLNPTPSQDCDRVITLQPSDVEARHNGKFDVNNAFTRLHYSLQIVDRIGE